MQGYCTGLHHITRGFLVTVFGFLAMSSNRTQNGTATRRSFMLTFFFNLSQWMLMLRLAVSNTFQPQIFAHSPSVHIWKATAEYRMNSWNWVKAIATSCSLSLTLSVWASEPGSRKGSQNDRIQWKARGGKHTSHNAILQILAHETRVRGVKHGLCFRWTLSANEIYAGVCEAKYFKHNSFSLLCWIHMLLAHYIWAA